MNLTEGREGLHLLAHKSKILFSRCGILIKYTLIPSIPLSIIAILSANTNTWVTSETHYFYIELIAVTLSTVLAFYYILSARTFNDKFSLFIGIGFLTITLFDVLHVIVSYVAIYNFEFLKYFVPQTWFVGRMFLSTMLVIAISKYSSISSASTKEEREELLKVEIQQEYQQRQSKNKLQKTVIIYLIMLIILTASVAISSLFLVLPTNIKGYYIHRPYEIPPLILFTAALFYFYKNHLHKRNDVFYKGLLGYLIINIFSQIIMSYSVVPFDTAHNVAHVLKDAGYFINIIALALSSIQYTERLKEREELIAIQYEKLKESDRMKTEFINVAAHDLGTPIMPILGLTEVLLSEIKDTKQQEILNAIIRNAKRSERLTNNILDVTRIESHSLNLKMEQFNLNDVITNTITNIKSNRDFANNGKKKDTIRFSYHPHDMYVEADRERMTQVIFNLLNNAVKFTEVRKGDVEAGERTVSISVETVDNSQALVTVKDSGIGIDPEIMPRLFQKFASKSYQGIGLGLFISKSIIEAHGGRMWAENNVDRNGQRGAAIYFGFPLTKK